MLGILLHVIGVALLIGSMWMPVHIVPEGQPKPSEWKFRTMVVAGLILWLGGYIVLFS